MSILLSIALAAAQAGAPAPMPMTMPMSGPMPGPMSAVPAPTGYTTAATPVGTLIADPAAKIILEKYLPGISSNPRLQAVLSVPLKSIQPYAPDKITDAKLAAIDADLAMLPKAK